jgi:uncharacterized protein YcfL
MISVIRISAIVALACAMFAATGAAADSRKEGGARIDQRNDDHPALNSVRVIDKNLAKRVSGSRSRVKSFLDVESVNVSTGPTGFKKVTVLIRNKSTVAIPLEARASWYDAGGVPSDPAQSWTHLFLQPQSLATFEQSSSRLNSSQYYVEIRGAQ